MELITIFQHQIFLYFSKILENEFISEFSRDCIYKFLMDKTEPLSFISLIKSAINNEINIG